MLVFKHVAPKRGLFLLLGGAGASGFQLLYSRSSRSRKKRTKSIRRSDDAHSNLMEDQEVSDATETGKTSKPQPQKVSAVGSQSTSDGSPPKASKANGNATIDPSLSLPIDAPGRFVDENALGKTS